MHRLIERRARAIGACFTQRGRGQHTKGAGEHGGTIRENIAEDIPGHHHIELLGVAYQLHGGVIDIHVRERHILIFRIAKFLHLLAPHLGGLQHVGLIHRAQLLAALAGQLKGYLADTGDFPVMINHRVTAYACAVFHGYAARFTKVDVTGQLTHDHDIQTCDDIALQSRGLGQRIKAQRGAEIGKQAQLLADAEQAALRAHRIIQRLPFRAADRTEQDGIGLMCFLQRLGGQGGAGLVIGRAADERMLRFELHAAVGGEPAKDFHSFANDFRANAVAGKQKDGFRRHRRPRLENGGNRASSYSKPCRSHSEKTLIQS